MLVADTVLLVITVDAPVGKLMLFFKGLMVPGNKVVVDITEELEAKATLGEAAPIAVDSVWHVITGTFLSKFSSCWGLSGKKKKYTLYSIYKFQTHWHF